MKKQFVFIGACLAGLVLAVAILTGRAGGQRSAASVRGAPEYLALGDSLTAGQGASDQGATAFVPLLYAHLVQSVDGSFTLANMGHNGDTSATLISHGHLQTAVDELRLRNANATPEDDIRLVTVTIGANDVFAVAPVCAAGLTSECFDAVMAAFATVSTNLDFILGDLRAAAPDTTIVVMSYYNALINPGCSLNALAPLVDVLLEGGGPVTTGLNDIIRSAAASHGARVAETVGLLDAADMQPDCRHANDAGYQKIGAAFVRALDE